jgi:hypothetical protein
MSSQKAEQVAPIVGKLTLTDLTQGLDRPLIAQKNIDATRYCMLILARKTSESKLGVMFKKGWLM